MSPRLSTILFIPCFNEEGRIGPLLERVASVREALDEIAVVDDGSTDGSLDEIRRARLPCRRHPGDPVNVAQAQAFEGRQFEPTDSPRHVAQRIAAGIPVVFGIG